ncbi:Crp/Fnr family transcriptional regulator [Kineobactrum salinum]|uniref:Crp/Fnr family transcriptional regulator n=1 Tax=Kineobactrum salinum TaxID=2708301 RepID=UPI0018D7E48E|nr:Crp/Fnr family transcriptional regulator [Kineobactrum salinum]
MTKTPPPASRNRLLAALPAQDQHRFLTVCEEVKLESGSLLSRTGDPVSFVYFPCESFISLMAPATNPGSLEVGLVGTEGMLGTSLLLGVAEAPLPALVQGEGGAWRIAADDFLRQLREQPALRRRLERYLYVTLLQLAQAAACNRFHRLEERVARWMLMTLDRCHSASFHMTHEFLASMLGVRRAGVTGAARALKEQGLIDYRRGELTVIDHTGLLDAACSCYGHDGAVYARILGS